MQKKNIITFGIIVIFFIVVIIIGGYFWTSKELQQKIIFINNSDILIDLAEIKYCNKILNLNDVASQKSISQDIASVGDCNFAIKIIFNDGAVVEKNNLGYLTSNDGSDNIFIVTQQKELIFSQEY